MENRQDIEIYVKTESERETNASSNDEHFYDAISKYIYNTEPENKIEYNKIILSDQEIDGYEIVGDKIKILYVEHLDDIDFDVKNFNRTIDAITACEGLYDTINDLEKAFDYDDIEYNFYKYFIDNRGNTTILLEYFTNKEFKKLDTIFIKGFSLDSGLNIDAYDINRIEKEIKRCNEDDCSNIHIKLQEPISSSSKTSSPSIDAYLFSINTEELAKMYDKYKTSLLQDNVRLFLATSKINKGIIKSLENNPELFISFNNGLSAVCSEIILDENENIVGFEDLQIVNGGQTTASIYEAYNKRIDLSRSFVQIKLTVVKDKSKYNDLVLDIAKFANSQNKINNSDFYSADKYFIEFEKQARLVKFNTEDGPKQIFFERMRGQFKIEENNIGKKELKEKYTEKIDMKVIAQLVLNWEQKPSISSKGGEKALSYYVENFKPSTCDIDNFKEIVALRKLEQSITRLMEESTAPGDRFRVTTRSKNFGTVASRIKNYTIVAISYDYKDKHNLLQSIFDSDNIDTVISDEIINDYITKVWNFFKNVADINEYGKKDECESKFELEFKNI